MTGYCGACGADLGKPVSQIMHPGMGDGSVLCGVMAKRTVIAATLDDVVNEDPKPTTAAHEALAALIRALEYHEEMESAPCEVRGVDGWVDVMDLAVEIGKALDA